MSYPKWNFRRQCVAMVDDGWPVISIPAVEFHTAATRQKHLAVHVDGGLAVKLVARQVCVVRRLDVVMRHRMVHILGKIHKIYIVRISKTSSMANVELTAITGLKDSVPRKKYQ